MNMEKYKVGCICMCILGVEEPALDEDLLDLPAGLQVGQGRPDPLPHLATVPHRVTGRPRRLRL